MRWPNWRFPTPGPRSITPALLGAGGLVALLAGLTRVGMGVPIFARSQLAAWAAAARLQAAFVRQEKRAAEPLVPLALFGSPTVRISCFVLFVGFMQLVALTVLVPMRLQLVSGLETGAAALHLMPLTARRCQARR